MCTQLHAYISPSERERCISLPDGLASVASPRFVPSIHILARFLHTRQVAHDHTFTTPALLLLEVMAQPTSQALDDDNGEESSTPKYSKKSEYGKLLSEHRSLHKKQNATVKSVFSAVSGKDTSGKITPKKKKDAEPAKKPNDKKSTDASLGEESKQRVDEQGEESKQKVDAQALNPPLYVPAFLPLLHTETQEACMVMCMQLLGHKSKKGMIDKAHLEKACPPPVILSGESQSN